MHKVIRRTLLIFGSLFILIFATFPAISQEKWPAKPIKLVVPYAAAGTTDMIARLFGDKLSAELGQSVIIENRGGAGTNLGASHVADARADGYTLLLGNVFQVLNPIFGPAPNFDLFKSLKPISLVADIPFLLAANPKEPYGDGQTLVKAAKETPEKLSVANAQLDASLELLNQKAGMQLLLVPYKGGGPAATDAIGGQVNMVYALVPVLQPYIEAGKLKALAVTSNKRFDGMPKVPTFVESGVDFDMTMWYGVFAPSGTPDSIVNRLTQAIHTVVNSKEIAQRYREMGANPKVNTPREFQVLLQKDNSYWQNVAKEIPTLVKKK